MNTPLWTIGGGIKHFFNLRDFFIDKKRYYDTTYKFFDSVYDSIFGLRWNGGRICDPRDTVPLTVLFKEIEEYNELNIGFNWSFTNLLITEEDLKNEYCNIVLEATQNSRNGVILTSPLLRDYIKKEFPKFKIIFSVCNGLKTIDEYKRALDENDLVVLHPDFNHDYKFLDSLPEKNRIEVMANDVCSYGCPYRKAHYLTLSELAKIQSINPILHDEEDLDRSSSKSCMAVQNGYDKDMRNVLSFEDLDNLLSMGFKHFKIIGREHEWDNYYNNFLDKNIHQYWVRCMVKETNQHHHI